MIRTKALALHRRPTAATIVALTATTALAAVLLLFATPARAGVSADINIRLGDRPAPVVVFEQEPEVVLVPRSRVYYVEHAGYDLYRYGRYWYVNDAGFWFRASSYRGPFVGIEFRHVPRSIVVVPDRYRRHPAHPHGGPPGQLKKQRTIIADDGNGLGQAFRSDAGRSKPARIDRDDDDRGKSKSRGKGKKGD